MKLPGFSIDSPSLPPPPPPPPKRTDPAIAAAAKKQRAAELNRKGRRSLVVTGGAGVTSDAPLSQPELSAAQTLG